MDTPDGYAELEPGYAGVVYARTNLSESQVIVAWNLDQLRFSYLRRGLRVEEFAIWFLRKVEQ